tara:strand:+ start:2239 stop:3843 length:1605 start_codon:yes stop_codon:yes gene_type:complete
MANPFTKPSINLDTYERANPADEQLNWGQIATDITKTFTDIEDNRAKRKAAIEKSYREQQEKIAELNNKYDTKTIQQLVNTGVMSIGEQLASQYNLLKRGLVTEADFSLTQNNASAGFKSIKSYADAYNKRMNEFTERRKTKMENGEPTSSAEEAYDVETLLMFNNLNNKKLVSDRMGNLSVLTFDENGKPIEGESATVQQLEGLLYQETNNIDVTKVLDNMKKQVGKLSLDFAGVTKSGYRDLTQTQILAADTRFIQVLGNKNAEGHKQATKLLNGLVDQMVYDKFVAATYAVNNMSTAEGKAYTLGTQAEHDKFARENPGKENPIIVREYNKNSGLVQSFPTDEQVNKVKDWARASILGSFDASVKTKAERVSNRNYSFTKNLNQDKEQINTATTEALLAHQKIYDRIKFLDEQGASPIAKKEKLQLIKQLEENIKTTISDKQGVYRVIVNPNTLGITVEKFNASINDYDPAIEGEVTSVDGSLDGLYFDKSLTKKEAEDQKQIELNALMQGGFFNNQSDPLNLNPTDEEEE